MQILSDFGEKFQLSEGLKLINGKVEKIDEKIFLMWDGIRLY